MAHPPFIPPPGWGVSMRQLRQTDLRLPQSGPALSNPFIRACMCGATLGSGRAMSTCSVSIHVVVWRPQGFSRSIVQHASNSDNTRPGTNFRDVLPCQTMGKIYSNEYDNFGGDIQQAVVETFPYTDGSLSVYCNYPRYPETHILKLVRPECVIVSPV